MAKNTQNQIVAVDKYGQTHLQPAGNARQIEISNMHKAPQDRLKVFPYEEGTPMEEYVRKARGTAGTGRQDFAVTKLAEKNADLQAQVAKQQELIDKLQAEAAAKAADTAGEDGKNPAKRGPKPKNNQ